MNGQFVTLGGHRASDAILLAPGARVVHAPPVRNAPARVATVHAPSPRAEHIASRPSPAQVYPPTFLIDDGFTRKFAYGRTAARPYGIGWFGVFVAWLCTASLGFAIAASVPAHGATRHYFGAAPPSALWAPARPAVNDAPAPVAAGSRAAATAPSGVHPASAVEPPLFLISDLPRVKGVHGGSATLRTLVRAPHIRAKAASAHDVAPPEHIAREAALPPVQTPTRAKPHEQEAVEPAPPGVAKTGPAPAPAPNAAPTATFVPGSLEDLIRKEVSKEQKALHSK